MVTKQIHRAVARLDGFVEAFTGLGDRNSKGAATSVQEDLVLTPKAYEDLYHGLWLARRVVEAGPRYSLGAGLKTDDTTKAAWVQRTYSDAYPEGVYLAAVYNGATYGGAGLLLGSKTADMTAPWREGETCDWLDIVSKHQLDEKAYIDDPRAADHKQPLLFEINGAHPRTGLQFHPSRAIWFPGVYTLGMRRQQNHNFFGDSVLQCVHNELARYDLAWSAVSTMLQEASIAVVTLKGFTQALGSVSGTELEERMQLLALGKSVLGALFLNEGESLKRDSLTFSGFGDVFDKLESLVSGAANTPRTLLFKTSPGGLNATGESDLTDYRQTVEAERELFHRPRIGKLLAALGMPRATFDFPPLNAPTEETIEATRGARANADKAYIDAGGVDAIAVVLARHEDGTLGFKLEPATLQAMRDELAASQADNTPEDSLDGDPPPEPTGKKPPTQPQQ